MARTGRHFRPPALPEPLLTVEEAAAVLGIQPRTLYKWAYAGRLPVVKIGRLTRFRASTIENLIAQGERPVIGNVS